MTTNENMTARDWVLAALHNDRDALLEGVKLIFNCRDADVDDDGDIWISGPSTPHWLDEDGITRVGNALRAGDI